MTREDGQLERTHDRAYDLRQRLSRAVRWLREAEDIARLEMPAWPTADRIRDIYEQVSEDVLNGRTSVPPLLQRLRESEAENERLLRDRERLRDALRQIRDRPSIAAEIAKNALAVEMRTTEGTER